MGENTKEKHNLSAIFNEYTLIKTTSIHIHTC